MRSSANITAALVYFSTGIISLIIIYFNYPNLSLSAVVAANFATFALYAFDKSAAAKNRTRIPEFALLLAALFAGSVGALLAIKLIRHKSSKASFQFKLLIILVLQCLLAIYYFHWLKSF